MNEELLEKIRRLPQGYPVIRGLADKLNRPQEPDFEPNQEREHLASVYNSDGELAHVILWGWSLHLYSDINSDSPLDKYYLFAFIDGPGEIQYYGVFNTFFQAWQEMERQYLHDASNEGVEF